MKNKLCLLLLACLTFSTMRAQQILQPTNPNEACAQAWQNYHKADVLWKTGWGLFGAGAGLALAGSIMYPLVAFAGSASPTPDSAAKALNISAISILSVGGGMLFASIPCLAIGQARRKDAMKAYNDQHCYSPPTCEQIKFNYHKADVLWKTGWGLFGAGAGLAISGGILIFPGGALGSWSNDVMLSGWAFLGVGCGMVAASIPCLAVGQVRRKAARTTFNEQCGEQPPLTFSLQTSANGLGLAMQF